MKPIFKNRPNKSYKIGNKEIWESRSPASVGIIFGFINKDLYVLAEKRAKIMPDAPGLWVVPCGYMDWDENGWDALRREVYEETSFFIDDYKEYIVFNNDKQPFYVMTEPHENRQNVALNYCLVFDFCKIGLPLEVEQYKDKEIEKVRWIHYSKINNYKWAFEHNKRIKMALKKFQDWAYTKNKDLL
jgi:8-oxo-dGTP pyrophosphatase MutT (NUDIX family)